MDGSWTMDWIISIEQVGIGRFTEETQGVGLVHPSFRGNLFPHLPAKIFENEE